MYHFAALWSSFHIHNHYLLNSPNTSEKYRKTLLKTEKSTESCWALSERGVDLPEEQEKGHRRRWLPSSCWTNSGPSEEQSVLIQRRTCFLTLRNKLSSFQLKKKKRSSDEYSRHHPITEVYSVLPWIWDHPSLSLPWGLTTLSPNPSLQPGAHTDSFLTPAWRLRLLLPVLHPSPDLSLTHFQALAHPSSFTQIHYPIHYPIPKLPPTPAPHPNPNTKCHLTLETSLLVQWLRICLPVQGTQIWSLVWESHRLRSNWACAATEPAPLQCKEEFVHHS